MICVWYSTFCQYTGFVWKVTQLFRKKNVMIMSLQTFDIVQSISLLYPHNFASDLAKNVTHPKMRLLVSYSQPFSQQFGCLTYIYIYKCL